MFLNEYIKGGGGKVCGAPLFEAEYRRDALALMPIHLCTAQLHASGCLHVARPCAPAHAWLPVDVRLRARLSSQLVVAQHPRPIL
ncbi:hypothetical protein HAX54_028753, partial [Datura stramonium]|nr:hypothetical protein [Datura stramonium]